jgi:hypothetical protein
VGSSANKPKIYYFKILEKKEGKKKSLMTLVMHVVNMHSARHLSNHNYNYNYNYQKHQALFDICIQSCFKKKLKLFFSFKLIILIFLNFLIY